MTAVLAPPSLPRPTLNDALLADAAYLAEMDSVVIARMDELPDCGVCCGGGVLYTAAAGDAPDEHRCFACLGAGKRQAVAV